MAAAAETEAVTLIRHTSYDMDFVPVQVCLASVRPQETGKFISLIKKTGRQPDMAHLQRVRKVGERCHVLLCAASRREQLCDELKQLLLDVEAEELRIEASARAPRTREQFETWGRPWPLRWKPTPHRSSEAKPLTEEELVLHRKHMRRAIQVAAEAHAAGHPCVGCVVANPSTGAVVVAAGSMRDDAHPLDHAPMVAMERVARKLRSQQSGETRTDLKLRSQQAGLGIPAVPESSGTAGGSSAGSEDGSAPPAKRARVKYKDTTMPPHQYLCTNLDVYLTDEPCMMCGMGLLHSRVRRVFFAARSAEDGAFVSTLRLHTLESLNHNFFVYEGLCTDEWTRERARLLRTSPPPQ